MQLFVALSAPRPLAPDLVERAVRAVQLSGDGHPGLAGSRARPWTSGSGRTAVVELGHRPERSGGAARVRRDGDRRIQVLDGIPIVTGAPVRTGRPTPSPDASASRPGAAPAAAPALDAEPPIDVTGADGRFALLDVGDDDDVTLTCSRIGSYPVYVRRLPEGVVAIGNSAAVLAGVPPYPGFDEDALEDFLVASWVFGDRTVWDGIRRLPPGRTALANGRLVPSSARLIDSALEAAERPVHRQLDVGAELLRDAVAAVARTTFGPLEIGLSGGRDSRVILAAVVAAGLRPHLFTVALAEDPAYPETGDVLAARRVAQDLDLPHEVRTSSVSVDDSERWLRALVGGVSALDASPSSTVTHGPTPVVLSGAAVELGWLTHGIDLTLAPAERAIDEVVRAWVHRFPGHLGTAGAFERTILRGCAGPRAWHAEGLPSSMIAESFFAFERTAGWAAQTHFAYTPFFDTVSPGWSADLLPALWSLDARDREQDRWRRGVIHALCPEIENLPFSGGSPTWPDEVTRSSYMLRGERRERVRRFVGTRLRGNGIGRVPEQVEALRSMQRDLSTALDHDDRLRRLVDLRRARRLSRASVGRLDPRSLQRLVRLTHVARLRSEGR